ncbi:MAG: hypothetical protein ACFBQW_00765, partial [Sphingomonadaceae bacterium]
MGGGAGGGGAGPPPPPPPQPEPVIDSAGLPPLPETTEILEGVDQPVLIVRNRRVLLANSAAREVLGKHIEGVDVRLAIRHPAAAERLTDRRTDAAQARVDKTELVGLGERDRRWEMTTARLADGSRLVGPPPPPAAPPPPKNSRAEGWKEEPQQRTPPPPPP